MNMDIFTQKDIFPEHVFLNFINVWNIKKVLTVPRKPEFPCEPNQCHYNVGLNQILKGGESVIGFSVSNIGQNVVLEPHSVWKTPEDNLDYKDEYIDVTPNIYSEETDIKFLPLKDTIWFGDSGGALIYKDEEGTIILVGIITHFSTVGEHIYECAARRIDNFNIYDDIWQPWITK